MTESEHVVKLVQRARGGDRDALGHLYDLYAHTLFNAARRMLDSGPDAEDVVHDVFVGLSTALRSYEERGNFEGWIKRIGTRVALMKLRRRKLMSEVTLAEPPAQTPRTIDSVVLDAVVIQDALRRLPDALRVTLLLKEVEGFSHAEIAEMEGVTVTASRARLFRAREMLRHLLEEPQ